MNLLCATEAKLAVVTFQGLFPLHHGRGNA